MLPLKIVRIEQDRHRLGLSLREARSQAEIRGWQFDDEGRVVQVPDEAREAFPAEAAAAEVRYAQRREELDARRSARDDSRGGGGGGRQSAPQRDDSPPLTAIAAAMQQAQAELAEAQETDGSE